MTRLVVAAAVAWLAWDAYRLVRRRTRPIGFRAVCNCGWRSSFYPHSQDAESAARAHTFLGGAHSRDGAS